VGEASPAHVVIQAGCPSRHDMPFRVGQYGQTRGVMLALESGPQPPGRLGQARALDQDVGRRCHVLDDGLFVLNATHPADERSKPDLLQQEPNLAFSV
jgi:hypothetical protein